MRRQFDTRGTESATHYTGGMNALVTGAAGFVGRALVHRLRADGHRVRVVVHRRVIAADGVEVVHADLAALDDASPIADSIDVVFHLAGLNRNEDGEEALRGMNVRASAALARLAARAGARRFVHLSTVKVHGETSGDSALREDDPFHPVGPYASSKAEGERAVREILDGTSTEWTIVRSPLVYGEGGGGNFAALVRAVELGLPLPFASVANRRSLVYAENLADALCFLASSAPANGKVFFVSDGRDVSTADLVSMVADALGRPARLFGAPPSLVRAVLRLAGRGGWATRLTESLAVDSSKIEELGWRAPHDSSVGLRRTVAATREGGGGR